MRRSKHLAAVSLLLTCLLLQSMGCGMHRPPVLATSPSPLVGEEAATTLTSAATLAQLEPVPAPTDDPAPYVHTVRWQGETLSLIAQWYTADISAWKALAEYNRIADPKLIEIGDRILIPELLLKNRTPMPHGEVLKILGKHALSASTKGKTAASKPMGMLPPGHGITTPRASRLEMELFGPDDIASPVPVDEGLGLYGPRE